MRETVMIYLSFPTTIGSMLADRYEVLDPGAKKPNEAYSAEQLAKVRAAVSMGGGGFSNTLMDTLPNLKMIACHGTGYDGVDLAKAKAKGITISNNPGANAIAVAEQAMNLMLAATRSTVRADHIVRSGQWAATRRAGMPAALGLHGTKVGIYGMGEIGRKIAARCAGFESDVQYFSRRKLADVPYRYHDTLESLVEWCDILHIAVRASSETESIINAAMLKRLGPKGFLINIARGSVVDEDALVDALKNKIIAGAGLDVMQNEPDVRADLRELPNVVFAPHQGGNTADGHARMNARVIENLEAFLQGKPVPYPVSPP